MNEEANNIKFVQLVEKYPCLYDFGSSEYSRRDITEKAWAEIGEEMKCTVAAAKEKWKNLRTVFVRKRKPHPSGSGKKQIKPYYFSTYMEFIIPFIKTQSSEYGNVPAPLGSPPHRETNENELSSDNTDAALLECQITESDKPQSPVSRNISVSKRKKKVGISELDKSDMEYFEAKKKKEESSLLSENPRRKFLESLLPECDEMPEQKFRIFKRKVLQLIDDINSDSNQSTSRTTEVIQSLSSSSYTSSLDYPRDQSPSQRSDTSSHTFNNYYPSTNENNHFFRLPYDNI